MNKEIAIDIETISMVHSRLMAVMDEVGEKVERQAQGYSTAYLRDLGVALCDATGRIIAQGDWMPVHTGGANIAIKAYLDKF